ncbi:hypothetical protein [Catonella massiliensis]|uniref:PD-(D/E)XK nuclease family transposase n=1 Tax=Catonella massiliensis TaxID=2799636 RepID=A0ABS1J1G8_9FIRM|nr:hypothetical protein [Catonella massiliensis]MBK5897900.1 hypothetical protein [Catonella massiliensis]
MNTEIKNAVNSAGDKAQYDENAKRLLGNKSILAHILTSTVEEFRDMDPADVEGYIEGEPCISSVPVEPGLTNIRQCGKRLAGLNSESADVNEGVVRFDIVFYVRLKDGVSQIIINIEAQKDAPSGYSILNRGIFYACRLISSQKERDFVNTNYDDIKCVYTIWICMNMPENSLDYYQLANRKALGSRTWEGKLDMINIVLIGLAKDLPIHDEKYELHRLLVALMSKQLTTSEKINIIEKEYKIQVNDTLRKDVSVMCNLSQGIVDETLEKVILNMHRLGYTSEQIAKAVEMSKEEVEKIIEINKLTLA